MPIQLQYVGLLLVTSLQGDAGQLRETLAEIRREIESRTDIDETTVRELLRIQESYVHALELGLLPLADDGAALAISQAWLRAAAASADADESQGR